MGTVRQVVGTTYYWLRTPSTVSFLFSGDCTRLLLNPSKELRMDKNVNSKPWYKNWWIWAIIIIALATIGYIANPKASSPQTSSTSQTPTPKQWTKLSELIGDTKEKVAMSSLFLAVMFVLSTLLLQLQIPERQCCICSI
jgi:hypothetical protein